MPKIRFELPAGEHGTWLTPNEGGVVFEYAGGTEPPPGDAIQTGADPAVLDLGFDVEAYASAHGMTIPQERGPVIDPMKSPYNATGDGRANDTDAVERAIGDLPSGGGVLNVAGGMFAVTGSFRLGHRDHLTVRGGGIGTGFRVHPSQQWTGNRFNAVFRLDPSSGQTAKFNVFRDFEIDCNDRPLGGITTQRDRDTWICNIYVHDIGGDASGNRMPAGAIKGIDDQERWHVIGCRVERTFGKLPNHSGCRGIWTTANGNIDSGKEAHIAHNIVRLTGHTGIICHGELPTSVIQYNSVFQVPATHAGAMKPELPGSRDNSWNPYPNITQIWRRNFATGGARWPIQPETMGVELRENLFTDWARGPSTFSRFRYFVVEDNVIEGWHEHGFYIDTNSNNPGDRTNLFIRHNTFAGKSGQNGVYFGSGISNARHAFDGGNPIEISNNKVIGIAGADVRPSPDLRNYDKYAEHNNGGDVAGARSNLLAPSYA